MEDFMEQAYRRIRGAAVVSTDAPARALPSSEQLAVARAALLKASDTNSLAGFGPEATLDHLVDTIAPALNGQNRSGRYWGFVTGSTLPIAETADNLVSAFDQSLQVHLPDQSIATEVEDAALKMLLRLLHLGGPEVWQGRTFTTGATGSNVLGLACAREAVINRRLPADAGSVGELGLLGACTKAGIKEIQILTSMGHSSLSKAASIIGLGRASIREMPHSDAEPWRLNIEALEKELRREHTASIIAISAGEVNTGRFATTGNEDMKQIRELANRYEAWIHIDGAFGVFARVLPDIDEFARLRATAAGLELADSITVDGHKLLNVPYDTGIFFTRQSSISTNVFQNPNAVYLSSGAVSDILSPLNIGIENSRRFRALPVYAVLMSEGEAGLSEMLARMVRLARGIAQVIKDLDDYALLPTEDTILEDLHMVVLFRAKDDGLNEVLVKTINASRDWYISGTKWKGQTACRIAVSTWRADLMDIEFVRRRLSAIAEEHRSSVS